jgi:hypothetical protein
MAEPAFRTNPHVGGGGDLSRSSEWRLFPNLPTFLKSLPTNSCGTHACRQLRLLRVIRVAIAMSTLSSALYNTEQLRRPTEIRFC